MADGEQISDRMAPMQSPMQSPLRSNYKVWPAPSVSTGIFSNRVGFLGLLGQSPTARYSAPLRKGCYEFAPTNSELAIDRVFLAPSHWLGGQY